MGPNPAFAGLARAWPCLNDANAVYLLQMLLAWAAKVGSSSILSNFGDATLARRPPDKSSQTLLLQRTSYIIINSR